MITKKIKYFLFVMLMLIGIRNVSATTNSNIVDFDKKGSISITLNEVGNDLKVSGADIAIYKVADAITEDSNLSFDYMDNLEEYETMLNDGIITDEMVKIIEESEVVNYSGVTNHLGKVEFTDLDLGLYLIMQTNEIEGFSSIEPFLVYIPKVIENQWVYDVETFPKVDIIRLFDLSVEKVWNISTDSKIPSEVSIELLKEDKVVDTIVLNNENSWNYIWKQIELDDDYSVREKNVPDGYTVTYKKDGNKFIVTNTKSLVQTGRSIFVIPVIAILGLMFIVIGMFLEKRKKYE